jgi:Transcription factor WhiB
MAVRSSCQRSDRGGLKARSGPHAALISPLLSRREQQGWRPGVPPVSRPSTIALRHSRTWRNGYIKTFAQALEARAWTAQAACCDSDADFLADDNSSIDRDGSRRGRLLEALETCTICPVRRDCLAEALGGLSMRWVGLAPRCGACWVALPVLSVGPIARFRSLRRSTP